MVKQQDSYFDALILAVDRLGPLADEMVFLGGYATGLLITDPAAPLVRVTTDIDVITESTSLNEYYQLSVRLRQRGFTEDKSEGAPVCRWRLEGTTLDVMTTKPDLLGFGNQWYDPAMRNAKSITLPSGKMIRMVSAPYFLATKLEAFDGRGKGDYLSSPDIEDIVAVLDGRPNIADETKGASKDLQTYLARRFSILMKSREFLDALPGHLPGDPANQARVPLIKKRIELIAKDLG